MMENGRNMTSYFFVHFAMVVKSYFWSNWKGIKRRGRIQIVFCSFYEENPALLIFGKTKELFYCAKIWNKSRLNCTPKCRCVKHKNVGRTIRHCSCWKLLKCVKRQMNKHLLWILIPVIIKENTDNYSCAKDCNLMSNETIYFNWCPPQLKDTSVFYCLNLVDNFAIKHRSSRLQLYCRKHFLHWKEKL
jgi:hypothetical protein